MAKRPAGNHASGTFLVLAASRTNPLPVVFCVRLALDECGSAEIHNLFVSVREQIAWSTNSSAGSRARFPSEKKVINVKITHSCVSVESLAPPDLFSDSQSGAAGVGGAGPGASACSGAGTTAREARHRWQERPERVPPGPDF